jgi:LacI family transcriptional regulator
VSVTVADVARRAGVSRATAARILGGYAGPATRHRERVLRAAQELGYVPNKLAKSLAARHTRRIGVLLPDLENPFFARMYHGIEAVCERAGYTVLIANTAEDEERERVLVEDMLAERVDGLIVAPVSRHGVAPRLDVPVVLVDRVAGPNGHDAVLTDNHEAMCRAVRHLVGEGYRKPALVANLPHLSSVRERLAGWEAATAEAGVDGSLRLITPSYRLDDIEGIGVFLDRVQPDAVVTTDAVLGLAVYRAARELGIPLGREMGLVTFDDEPWMTLVDPAVTAVAQPTLQLGETAAERLIQRLTAAEPPVEVRLPSRLIVRASSQRLPP